MIRSTALALAASLTCALSASAATVTIQNDSTWTLQDNGFYTSSNNGLDALAGNMWGVSNNNNNVQGLIYKTFGDAFGGTIQAGTYTLVMNVGDNGNGGNDTKADGILTGAGSNGGFGVAAGFFYTVNGTNANGTKNNMHTEFNTVSGVTFSANTTAAPVDDAFVQWTLTWEIAEGSSVIGTDPFLGFYTKTGNGGGNGFHDDADLSFVPVPEPSSFALLGIGGLMMARRRK